MTACCVTWPGSFSCFSIKIYSHLKTIQTTCLFSWNISSWSQLIHLSCMFAMHRGKAASEALSPWGDVAGKFWFNHVGANHGYSAVFRLRRRVATWQNSVIRDFFIIIFHLGKRADQKHFNDIKMCSVNILRVWAIFGTLLQKPLNFMTTCF